LILLLYRVILALARNNQAILIGGGIIKHPKCKAVRHRHGYKKIILHYGSNIFVWGRQCEICERIDSVNKASNWSSKDFQITGKGLYGNWEDICLAEIQQKYPEYTIMTLKNAEWKEWTTKNDAVIKLR